MTRRPAGRLLGLAMLLTAGVIASPPSPHADPIASPSSGAPPSTVPRPDMPDAAARRGTNRARMLDARFERLHAALQLSPAQDKLWPPVAEAMRGLAEARGRRFRDQLDAVADPIEKLRMQGEHMAKVGAAMSRLADATKPLAATFTADQKGRLPASMERVPFRKVVSRAFGIPPDGDSAVLGVTPPGTVVAPTAGPAANKTVPARSGTVSPPNKESDDDE